MYKCYVSVILTFKAIVLFTYVTTFSSLSMFIVHYTVHTVHTRTLSNYTNGGIFVNEDPMYL